MSVFDSPEKKVADAYVNQNKSVDWIIEKSNDYYSRENVLQILREQKVKLRDEDSKEAEQRSSGEEEDDDYYEDEKPTAVASLQAKKKSLLIAKPVITYKQAVAKKKVGRPNFYKQIADLYDKGLSDLEISFELKIHPQTVYNWRSLNRKPPNRRVK